MELFFDQLYRITLAALAALLLLMGADSIRWIWSRRKVHPWAWVVVLLIGYVMYHLLNGLLINLLTFLTNQPAPDTVSTWLYRASTWVDLIVMGVVYTIMRIGLGKKAHLEYDTGGVIKP